MRFELLDMQCRLRKSTMNHWILGFLGLLLFGINFHPNKAQAQDARHRPNFVFVMVDDLGYRDVGCYGCVDFSTPNIDKLAKSGVRCTSGYVTHPYCSPSRAGFLSGRYQQRFGHEHNPPPQDQTVGIDVGTRTLPNHLKAAGYATGLIGKWHVGEGAPFRPIVRGFSEFYGFLGGGHHYFKALPDGKNSTGPMWRGDSPTRDELTYLTDDLTAEAEAFLDRNAGNPFCLLLAYNAPHAPDHVTDEYLASVANIKHPGRKKYAALVQGIDSGVGRVLAKLNSLKLIEKTLVVFWSDNGGRRGVSDNRPLRGNKGWLHEGGIRVPFIMSFPGVLAPNSTFEYPLVAFDLLPTALAMAKLPLPKDIDGVDLTPYLTGRNVGSPHSTIYWRVSGGQGFAVRQNNWKLVHDIAMDRPMLYDLANDIGENQDRAAQNPVRLENLLKEYAKWSNTLEQPRWTEGHTQNTTTERRAATAAGTRQFPMPWVEPDPQNNP